MSPHSIRTISLEVNCSGKVNGLALLEETSAWANGTLVPQVEQIFASLPESNDHIRIERLEIEVNSSSAANWRQEILARLKRELTAMLLDRVSTETSRLKTGTKLPREESFFRSLVFFLKHGVLPWSSAIRSRSEWDQAVTLWLSSIDAAGYKPRFVEVLATPAIRLRFIQSISAPALRKAMAVFFGVPERIWADWIVDAKQIQKTAGFSLAAGEKVAARHSQDVEFLLMSIDRSLFETIADHGFTYQRAFEIRAVAQVLTQLIVKQQVHSDNLESVEFISEAFVEARNTVLGASLTKEGRPGTVWPAIDLDAPEESTAGLSPAAEKGPQEAAAAREEPELPDADDAVEAGIYVSTAGSVLLAPFLPMFFDRIGVARDRQLLDAGMAMTLIHYLATGQEAPAEFQLVLPKILCGWEIEQDVALPDALPDEMKDEAGQLLSSMIEHWSVLKNTSPQGLRESFLQRSGKLTFTQRNDWLLQVEQKSFDMLLQQLPWSFQFIKLPWMHRLLRTEWVA